MSKENVLLIISVILSITIIVFSAYILFSRKDKVNNTQNQNEENSNSSIQEVEENNEETDVIEQKEFIHSAWIPSWDFDNGYTSLEASKELIKEVNPVLYGVNNDGTLLNRKPQEDSLKKLLLFCSVENIKVIPTIGSYDYKIMQSVLQSGIYIEKHIKEILSEIEKYNYDGIDIDYERIRASEREGYLTFLRSLKEELEKINKELSVTVFAKTRDGSTDTLYVQDWAEIGKIADKVKVMTYDYTLQTSTIPGPIGPTDWIEEVIKYSDNKIPSEKIYLGIHLYAYLWKEDKASALTYSSVSNILKNSNIQREYKTDMSEGYAQYTCSDGSKCTLFYQTPEGVKARVKIAQDNNLAGVSYWRLGNELDLL